MEVKNGTRNSALAGPVIGLVRALHASSCIDDDLIGSARPSIGAVSVLSRSILKQKLMGYLNQGEDILKRWLDFSFFFSARQFVFEICV
jgi:hypothetical protein